MAEKYTEAQHRAINKYMCGKCQIKITVTPEQRERYQRVAALHNMSLTQLIIKLLEEVDK